jgi:hypothetical protein
MRRFTTCLSAAFAACLVTLFTAPMAIGAIVHPQGATPKIDFFVISYKQCSVGNTTHVAPYALPSCSPPVATSQYLTAGTPPVNGAVASSIGHQRLDVCPAGPPCGIVPPDDVRIIFMDRDVRCMASFAGSSFCNTAADANNVGGTPTPPDYTGELRVHFLMRMTDQANNPGGNTDGTLIDIPFEYSPQCVSTVSVAIGAMCNVTTTFNAVMAGSASAETGQRDNIGISQVQVFDGGADGVGSTTGDNTLYQEAGIFLP